MTPKSCSRLASGFASRIRQWAKPGEPRCGGGARKSVSTPQPHSSPAPEPQGTGTRTATAKATRPCGSTLDPTDARATCRPRPARRPLPRPAPGCCRASRHNPGRPLSDLSRASGHRAHVRSPSRAFAAAVGRAALVAEACGHAGVVGSVTLHWANHRSGTKPHQLWRCRPFPPEPGPTLWTSRSRSPLSGVRARQRRGG